eukprot:COSAG02_NODE_9384_length_2234_cov_15.604372_2_plen_71_part_00
MDKSKNYNIATTMEGVQKKKRNSNRVTFADPRSGRMVSMNPYSKKAKELYRYYIEQEGLDPQMVIPPDLK